MSTTKATLQGFMAYLRNQLGQPYVWGGQHTKLTPTTYVSLIDRKEEKTGGYKNETYAQAAKAFCRKKFDSGTKVLYAYDCSGLGAYYLYNLTKAYSTDVTAHTMYTRCDIAPKADLPKAGWWVFRLSRKGRATHVGYMVTDSHLIEAKGRRDGVVETRFQAKSWDAWGIPRVFAKEIAQLNAPVPGEVQETPSLPLVPEGVQEGVEVVGGSVHVRSGDSTNSPVLFTAKRGQTFRLLGYGASGWYQIETELGTGYISNKAAYTRLVTM